MRTILILDTETTGLDARTDHVIEVGCALWSVEHATLIEAWSEIMRSPTGVNPAESVNGIPASALMNAADPITVWPLVADMAALADAIVAHGADFDRGFVPTSIRDMLPWICSCNDIEWPGRKLAGGIEPTRERPGQSLVALCLAHGLGVSHAHRALTDVLLLARLLERVAELGHNVGSMLSRGLRPKATFVAQVSYDDREKARAAGFRWDAGSRRWLRRMAIDDAAALPFPTRQALDAEAA